MYYNCDYEDSECWDEDSEIEALSSYLNFAESHTRNEKDSKLVTEAKAGNLQAVKQIIERCPAAKKVGMLNGARKWTEVEWKHGLYEKSWDWYGDTALIAAARAGNVEVVKYLLYEGADPTLKSCPSDDQYETAQEAAEKREKQFETTLQNIRKGTYHVDENDIQKGANMFVREFLQKLNSIKLVILLLKEAGTFWNSAEYAHASYNSNERAKAFVGNPNLPTNPDDLRKALDCNVSELNVDEEVLNELVAKYSLVLEKKKSKASDKQSSFNPQSSWNFPQSFGSQNGGIFDDVGFINAIAKACADDCYDRYCSSNCSEYSDEDSKVNVNSLAFRANATNENSKDETFNTGYESSEDSKLVTEAKGGNLQAVKQIIEGCPSGYKVGLLNGARKWTELQ